MRARMIAIILLGAVLIPAPLWAWGFEAHRIVNRGALEITPEPLRSFLMHYEGEIVAHAVDPDLWVEAKVLAPAWTHFIDLDLLDNAPFRNIPNSWNGALAKYGAQKLEKAGTLPWEIDRRERLMSEAMRRGAWDNAVREAAWIGHYAADSTMPLHATKDYRGEAAGNVVLKERGPNRTAHQRIEVGLVQHSGRLYESVRGDPSKVGRRATLAEAWRSVHDGFALVAAALKADREASDIDPAFGRAFYEELERREGAAMRRQLARAQEMVASAWLTAWQEAGAPAPPKVLPAVVWPEVGARAPTNASTWSIVAAIILAVLTAFGVIRRRRRRMRIL